MAKPKTEEILRRQKEAKQKKLLFVLAPIFLLLMVWQGPGYLKMLSGGGSDDSAAVATEPTDPTGAAPDPSTAPPPTTSTPGTASPVDPTATPTAAPGQPVTLPESDQPAPADEGQLVTFTRFLGKDPFHQRVWTAPTTDATVAGSGTSGGSTTSPNDPGNDSGSGGTPPPSNGGQGSGGSGHATFGSDNGGSSTNAPVAVTVRVNGEEKTVKLHHEFPPSERLFRVTKLTRTSAFIGLVAGEFSNGKKAIEVNVGKTLNLVSQPEGIRYRIKVLAIELG